MSKCQMAEASNNNTTNASNKEQTENSRTTQMSPGGGQPPSDEENNNHDHGITESSNSSYSDGPGHTKSQCEGSRDHRERVSRGRRERVSVMGVVAYSSVSVSVRAAVTAASMPA